MGVLVGKTVPGQVKPGGQGLCSLSAAGFLGPSLHDPLLNTGLASGSITQRTVVEDESKPLLVQGGYA